MSESHIQFQVVHIADDTEQERQMHRAYVAANMAGILEYTIRHALINKGVPPPTLLEWEGFQRNHITRFMRIPQNKRLGEEERLMGGKIDRLSLQCCDVVRAWNGLVAYRHSKAYRKAQETKRQAERQRKLAERRKRDLQKQIGAQPRVQTKKKAEHVEKELCEKCHKRPAVRDHLCGPCLDWERAKLGRE